jgi:hypothetical protein
MRTLVLIVVMLAACSKGDDKKGGGGGGGRGAGPALMLNKISKLAKVYYAEHAAFPKGVAALTPSGSACNQNGKTFAAVPWTDPVWTQLVFTIDEPQPYQFSYESADGQSFTVKAIGDTNCDGKMSTTEMTGRVVEGNPQITIGESTED